MKPKLIKSFNYYDMVAPVSCWKFERDNYAMKCNEIFRLLKQPQTNLHVEQLTVLAEQVLAELKLGKQASSYKSAQKALRRLIELLTTSTTSK